MANRFGAFVRQRRKEKGLTLGEVAEALGISVAFLSEVERGEKPPLQESYFSILAAVLEVLVTSLRETAQESRSQFRLDAKSVTPAHREFAAALERRWTALTEAQIREMKDVLGWTGGVDERRKRG